MCNYTDVVRIGQPDVNERLVLRETPASITLVQWYKRTTLVRFNAECCQRQLREGSVY